MLSTEEHIAQLIFLHLQGMTDEQQEEELSRWRDASAGHEALFQRMQSSEHAEKSISRFVKTAEERECGWLILQEKMDIRPKVKPAKTISWYWYAAMITVLLSVGGMMSYYSGIRGNKSDELLVVKNTLTQPGSRAILMLPDGSEFDLKNENSRGALLQEKFSLSVNEESLSYQNVATGDSTVVYHTLKVPRGGEYILMLSDSTEVYLNADTRLRYPVSFQGKERKVYLSGEAYFKVKKDERKPFIVEAEHVEVKVLGTTFNVRAYGDEQEIQTTLESGKVLVSAAGQRVNLVPGKQAVFNKQTSVLDARDVDIDLFMAWKEGRLMYDNYPLEKVLTDLSRWYAFDVFYSRDELRSYKFSLNMKKHEAFTQVLELIEKTGDIRFEVKNKTVIVK